MHIRFEKGFLLLFAVFLGISFALPPLPLHQVAASTQVNYYVAASADDAYGAYQDTWSKTANYVKVGSFFPPNPEYWREWTGHWRWSLNIPRGALIDSAYLTLKAYSSAPMPAPLHLQVHDYDNCPAFDSNPYSWSVVSSPFVDWELSGIVGGQLYTSPDISSLVQAIVNRNGYQPGNYLGLRMQFYEDGYYFWRSKDGGYAAQLSVVYRVQTHLTLTAPEWSYNGEPITLTAILTDWSGQPLQGKMVDFRIGGILEGSDDTNAGGVAVVLVNHTFAASGNRSVTAAFAGDAAYGPCQDSATIDIRGNGARDRYVVLVGFAANATCQCPENDVNDWQACLSNFTTWFTGHSTNHFKKFGDGDPVWDGNATVSNVRSAIRWAVTSGDGDDVVVISFTCHGTQNDQTGEGWLKLADGNYSELQLASDLTASQADYPDIIVWFQSCQSGAMDTLHTTPPNGNRILVLATCHAWGFGIHDGPSIPHPLGNSWFFYCVFNRTLSLNKEMILDTVSLFNDARSDYVRLLQNTTIGNEGSEKETTLDVLWQYVYINRPKCYPDAINDSSNADSAPAFAVFWL